MNQAATSYQDITFNFANVTYKDNFEFKEKINEVRAYLISKSVLETKC